MRWGLALAFALLLSVPAVAPQAPRPREVSVVVYHVSPDPAAGTPDADPYSGPPTGFVTGPDVRLPLTRVDNATTASDAPEGDPSSAAARFQELRRLVQERQREGTRTQVSIDATIADGTMSVRPGVSGQVPEGASLRITVVEDGLLHDGRVHRFVARHVLHGAALSGEWTVAIPPAWDAARLGVVVAVLGPDGESLNSATWLPGDGPVTQAGRAVLVEHVTATWCEPCAAGDAAVDLLASQSGFPAEARSGGRSYWVAPTPLGLAGLAAGALAGLVLIGRRAA